MKITKFYVLLLTAVSLSFAAKAQTADDIIGKYVDAIGGKDKLAQIKSVYTEATVNVMGSDNPASTTVLVGKGYRSEADLPTDFEQRFWLYFLRVALAKTVLRHRLGVKDRPGREPAALRIRQGLTRLEAEIGHTARSWNRGLTPSPRPSPPLRGRGPG